MFKGLNWYWMVDGLQEEGYKVHLANPSAIKQYEGLKHTDDKWDSFWLAHMKRLNILPEGYIYPRRDRVPYDIVRHFYNQSACGRESSKGLV